MKVAALLLTLSIIHTRTGQVHASLTVHPNRAQFFRYESLSLSCNDSSETSGWTVKAETVRGVSACGHDWGYLQTSSCVIQEAYQWNSGAYWCESTSGETSPAAKITITDNSVILESPASPVTVGDSVTLRCTAQSNSSETPASVFMKDRSPVSVTVTGQMTIPAVSKSDEGLYMCVVIEVGASAESWLSVTADPDSAAPPPPSVSRVILYLVVGAPYLASTVVLGLICRDKRKCEAHPLTGAQQTEEATNCAEVQMMEIV